MLITCDSIDYSKIARTCISYQKEIGYKLIEKGDRNSEQGKGQCIPSYDALDLVLAQGHVVSN